MSRSLDGPECEHGHNLFNPTPCPRCAREFALAAMSLSGSSSSAGCTLGSDCMCAEVHGEADPFCVHYRKPPDDEKENEEDDA